MSSSELPPGTQTPVSVDIDLLHLHKIDTSDKTVDVIFRLKLTWIDAKMTRTVNWNRLVISADKVWIPDVVVLNACYPPELIYDGKVAYSGEEGSLIRIIRVVIPYTKVSDWLCQLKLGSFSYTSDQQRFDKVNARYSEYYGQYVIKSVETRTGQSPIDGLLFDIHLAEITFTA